MGWAGDDPLESHCSDCARATTGIAANTAALMYQDAFLMLRIFKLAFLI
jgi:hypothetical protein